MREFNYETTHLFTMSLIFNFSVLSLKVRQ